MRGYLDADPAADRGSTGILAGRFHADRRPAAAPDQNGCGNAGAVETTNRFPPRLGNLAPTRDSHISTSRSLLMSMKTNEQEERPMESPRGALDKCG